MHARVARFEGASADEIDAIIKDLNSRGDSGPPEGVPAAGFILLADRQNGTSLAISFFETEDDMRTGDAALNAMSPPAHTGGRRAAVEFYEVGARFQV
jgi:hypothetical protein